MSVVRYSETALARFEEAIANNPLSATGTVITNLIADLRDAREAHCPGCTCAEVAS